jgi:hypothetical protein
MSKKKGYFFMICKKLSIRAMGIYDLQNYQSGQWVYMICKIINPGKGYIYDLQNYQSGQRS